MTNKMGATLVSLGFFVYIQLPSAQLQNYEPPKWNYTHFNEDCTSPGRRTYCVDIRICKSAVASLAIGGWPAVCGSVDNIVPKVCCGYPLALGGALMRKVEEEKERHSCIFFLSLSLLFIFVSGKSAISKSSIEPTSINDKFTQI
ncbi:hypothetical protein AVEN_90230-1 [Araneus ventricosus]|uniref:Single domain-containing protein n=1 Tax=Araneus ventricosus TaxID=182803 RepID=A0A4Y2MQN2_ARAVE|nr:hypothetical protein AVEN_267092-1 [Araneus ventricosus]GBN29440.1 hypothetical protein AVEN_90230-1 [Araneus ventricosus]